MRRRGLFRNSNKSNNIDIGSFSATETKDLVMPYARTQCFSPDFKTMYYTPQAEAKTYKYNISDPSDLTTISYSGEVLNIGAIDQRASGAFTNKFSVGRSTFYEYLINANFSLSTGDGLISIEGIQTGMHLLNDTVFLVDYYGVVTKRNLATSGDFTSAGSVVDTVNLALTELVYGISISPDGMQMYIGKNNGTILKYSLQSPFVLTGATLENSSSLALLNIFDFAINYQLKKLITVDEGVVRTYSYNTI